MSAKITVILFIFVCFSTGALLAWLPWTQLWDNNFFLNFVVEKTGWSSLISLAMSGYVRGAITGLGIINILIGALEVFHFKHSVRALQEDDVLS